MHILRKMKSYGITPLSVVAVVSPYSSSIGSTLSAILCSLWQRVD